MKFHFDITHPKQVMFFPPFIKELESRGHECYVTTRIFGRHKNFMYDFLKQRGISNVNVIGWHGGANREEKLINYIISNR